MGIGDGSLQQVLQVHRHSSHACSLKEIGTVLEPAVQALRRIDELEHEVNPRDTRVGVCRIVRRVPGAAGLWAPGSAE